MPTTALPDDLQAATRDADALVAFLDGLPEVADADVLGRAARTAVAPVDPDERRELANTAITLLECTVLDAETTPEAVEEAARRAAHPGGEDAPDVPAIAALRVHADRVETLATAVADTPVRASAVAGGYPHGRSPLPVRVAEVEAALAAGAEEIDVVLDRAAFLHGRPYAAFEQLVALREACGDARCTVTIEAGALPDAGAVQAAAWVAALAGADAVNTSTTEPGRAASFEAALVCLEVTRQVADRTGRTVGVEATGGIQASDEALRYLGLARAVGGDAQLEPARYRLGATSALLASLVAARAV
ncbi:deoxyribose-phosphate aldolase [Nitriliruptoraceae bacterium ZYF776]|nr:deoxyribose-phosphate aldolase [Profundirhabdus halotolerans]